MVQAVWNGKVIASGHDTVVVDGNHYFAMADVDAEMLSPSDTTSVCPWKGTAGYYSIDVDGQRNRDAAWFYADPKPAAARIKGRVAFWKGVQVG